MAVFDVKAIGLVQMSELMRDGEKRARRASMDAGLRYWQRELLPLHFGQEAHSRYRYTPRLFEYLRTKGQLRHLKRSGNEGREFPDRKPLEKTGAMKKALLAARGSIRDAQRGAALGSRILVLQAAKYVFQYRRRKRGGTVVNKFQELTTITREEQAEMAAAAGEQYRKRMTSVLRRGTGSTLREARARAASMVAM